jgi:hypothetical protein
MKFSISRLSYLISNFKNKLSKALLKVSTYSKGLLEVRKLLICV